MNKYKFLKLITVKKISNPLFNSINIDNIFFKILIPTKNNFKSYLEKLNYKVEIINELLDEDVFDNNENTIYIISINNRKDERIPKYTIYFQVDNEQDIKNVDNYLFIWKNNFNKDIFLNFKKIFYMPINNNNSEYFFKRNILPLINFNKINIEYNLIEDKIYILHLPETPDRLEKFKEQKIYDNNKNLFEVYPGIKYNPGWQGTALSYVNLINNAKNNNLKNITICEDDCHFPEDFIKKYSIIKEFLNIIDDWDIFVGVIADIPKTTVIKNIYKYKNYTFIELSSMNSMVFNIYNNKIYDKIIDWNFNNKTLENTIDSYIKFLDIKVIIMFPFLVDCLDVDSTIWEGNKFNEYNELFENSRKFIQELINDF
jgi:hypothetical protein